MGGPSNRLGDPAGRQALERVYHAGARASPRVPRGRARRRPRATGARCYTRHRSGHPSASMKLIASPTSPYARKVRIALAEKKIEYTLVDESPWRADTTVSGLNPLGKVPVLVLDDGATLFDSRVIVEYLDTVSPVSRLIPEPSRQRIAVQALGGARRRRLRRRGRDHARAQAAGAAAERRLDRAAAAEGRARRRRVRPRAGREAVVQRRRRTRWPTSPSGARSATWTCGTPTSTGAGSTPTWPASPTSWASGRRSPRRHRRPADRSPPSDGAPEPSVRIPHRPEDSQPPEDIPHAERKRPASLRAFSVKRTASDVSGPR